MVYLPGRANAFANAGPISRHALEFYSKLWFPYQFPQLTLQDGPSAAMEYPMVINSNRGAADHETAHQWWPMVVANNETWYGWMDEGFDQFCRMTIRPRLEMFSREHRPGIDSVWGDQTGLFGGGGDPVKLILPGDLSAGPRTEFGTGPGAYHREEAGCKQHHFRG